MSTLRPVEFHVLLALASGPAHGYGLVRRIADHSEGRLSILPGNLYTVIRRLVAFGLVRETDAAATPPEEDSRRRYFELSSAGRARLSEEARHLQTLVERVGALPISSAEKGGGHP